MRTAESGGGFAQPLLTVFIIADDLSLVKPFLKFFLPRPAVPLPEACGCVLSAWLTFIYRATGLRAVGVLGTGLI